MFKFNNKEYRVYFSEPGILNIQENKEDVVTNIYTALPSEHVVKKLLALIINSSNDWCNTALENSVGKDQLKAQLIEQVFHNPISNVMLHQILCRILTGQLKEEMVDILFEIYFDTVVQVMEYSLGEHLEKIKYGNRIKIS